MKGASTINLDNNNFSHNCHLTAVYTSSQECRFVIKDLQVEEGKYWWKTLTHIPENKSDHEK